jgi:hypothetical protein
MPGSARGSAKLDHSSRVLPSPLRHTVDSLGAVSGLGETAQAEIGSLRDLRDAMTWFNAVPHDDSLVEGDDIEAASGVEESKPVASGLGRERKRRGATGQKVLSDVRVLRLQSKCPLPGPTPE